MQTQYDAYYKLGVSRLEKYLVNQTLPNGTVVEVEQVREVPISSLTKEVMIAEFDPTNRELLVQSSSDLPANLSNLDLSGTINIRPVFYFEPTTVKINQSSQNVTEFDIEPQYVDNETISVLSRQFWNNKTE